ncbi:MAG TPA: GAF domain-containing protein [Blastocatellia bacterium]|nr:GAF domain-containing protein [Blastocatellia bacterium]
MAEGRIQQAQDSRERLARLYELALTVAGDPTEVFDHIVRIIAELFEVRVALVEKLEGDKIITLSMYLDGKILHEGVFDLAGTPCAGVRERREFCSFNRAAQTFPQDEFLKEYGIDSYIGVPVISSEGEVIAIVNAMNDRPLHLSSEDRVFLEAMASRVRLELERMEKAQEVDVIRLLLDITQEISRLKDSGETLQKIVDAGRALIGVDMAAIATVDDATGVTSWKAASGFKTDAFLRVRFAPGRGTAGRAIAAQKTVVLEGIGRSPDLSPEEFPIHMAEGMHNALGVPIINGGQIIGVLIGGYSAERGFTDLQIKIAEALAAQAGVAIENARMYTELASANERLVEADRFKTELIAELSTPIIPIWDKMLLAPIIGTLSTERAEALTEALLKKTASSGAEVVIIDITGVRTVDTEAAHHIRNTITAIRILGANCILTGIGAAIAQTLVQLGISLEGIQTRRKLSDGLQLALDLLRKS